MFSGIWCINAVGEKTTFSVAVRLSTYSPESPQRNFAKSTGNLDRGCSWLSSVRTSKRQDDTKSKFCLPSSLIRPDTNHVQEQTKQLAKIIGYSSLPTASISKDFTLFSQCICVSYHSYAKQLLFLYTSNRMIFLMKAHRVLCKVQTETSHIIKLFLKWAVTRVRRLVAGMSKRRPGFDPR